MADITRIELFDKLNSLLYKSIESATGLCKLRGNSHVELVHWLNQIYQLQGSDLHQINKYFEINSSKLSDDLSKALGQLPTGASSISDISFHIDHAVQEAWLYTSLMFKQSKIRSGYLLLGILQDKTLEHVLLTISDEFKRLNSKTLFTNFDDICSSSPEKSDNDIVDGFTERSTLSDDGDALGKYTIDLTKQAREGKLDPVVGRDDEIREMIDILMRRRQNNPILTGEAGVGKTAVIEGFALKVIAGDVPPAMRDVLVKALDIGLLQAGASAKGVFEERLKDVIETIKGSPQPVILFIDEAHTLIGAGGQAGTGDAANLLKPELARGGLRTIAATTWSEYKKYIEKDPALTRRFQVIKIEEPEESIAVSMLRGIKSSLVKHHDVPILESALESAVTLSKRYISDRQLPDKAVSLLDTACARVALSQFTEPGSLDNKKQKKSRLEMEYDFKRNEQTKGVDYNKQLQELEKQIKDVSEDINQLDQAWLEQKQLVEKILMAEKDQDDAVLEAQEAQEDLEANVELNALRGQLAERHKQHGLVYPYVSAQVVAEVVSSWTGIPLGHMIEDEGKQLLQLEDRLQQRVFGQTQVLTALAKQIRVSRSGLSDPNAPRGVFLLSGSSGVGKTETALALAELLYGGEQNLITINMSEFQESHTVSTLKGAPPGYVGYGEGGVLTEAVRRKPYSVILLDEVEKAHPDIHEIFFQVFDKGWMEDGEGRYIDFKNSLILLTSNVGSDVLLEQLDCDQEHFDDVDIDKLSQCLAPELRTVFPDAFIGRLTTIPYLPLSRSSVRKIIEFKLNKVTERFEQQFGLPVIIEENIHLWLMDKCQVKQSGARLIGNIINKEVTSKLSDFSLSNLALLDDYKSVSIVCNSERGIDVIVTPKSNR